MAECPANCGALDGSPAQARDRVRVLLPLPLPAALDYRCARWRSGPGARAASCA